MSRIRQLIRNKLIYSLYPLLFYVPIIALTIIFSVKWSWFFLIFTVAILIAVVLSFGLNYMRIYKSLSRIYRLSKSDYTRMLEVIRAELEDAKSTTETEVFHNYHRINARNSVKIARISGYSKMDQQKLLAVYKKLEEIALRNKPKTDPFAY